jgi:hypothetical protein
MTGGKRRWNPVYDNGNNAQRTVRREPLLRAISEKKAGLWPSSGTREKHKKIFLLRNLVVMKVRT